MTDMTTEPAADLEQGPCGACGAPAKYRGLDEGWVHVDPAAPPADLCGYRAEAPDTLPKAIVYAQQAQLAIGRGGTIAEKVAPAASIEAEAAWLDALGLLLDEVRLVHSLAERRLGDRMHAERIDRLDREDAPPVELNVSKNRTGWQSDRLLAKVRSTLRQLAVADTDRCAVDPATGSRDVPTFDQALEGVLHVYSLGGGNARMGRATKAKPATDGLRSIGIDPDDYCEGGPDAPRYTARVVR